MVAFKEEFPYLKAETGQLFEFDRGWLREAITRAANDAGYPSWWLTEHVTESIAFYLRLRNDESFIAFNQLSQTVRYVLKVIGYKEIVPHFSPTPPPVDAPAGTVVTNPGDLGATGRAQSLRETSARYARLVSGLRCSARGDRLFRSRKTFRGKGFARIKVLASLNRDDFRENHLP